MSKYVLIYNGGGMPATEAEQKQAMQAWEAWFGKLGKAVVDQGDPFTPNVKSIASGGSITNGAATGPATGYSIIEASSLDEAVKLAKGCPVLQVGAQISVFETAGMM